MPVATVYTSRVTNWPNFWFGIGTFSVNYGVNLTVPGPLWGEILLNVGLALTAAQALLTTSQRISAGPNGLIVNFGFFGFPRYKISRESIYHVEIVRTAKTGGWGIAGRRKRVKTLALRGGPALHIRRTDGRSTTVGLPDPAAAMHAMGIFPYHIEHQPDRLLDKRSIGPVYGVGLVAPHCPRCAQPWGRFAPARTRMSVDRPIYICSACTIDEAVRAVSGHPAVETSAWPVAARVDPREYVS
ncbi:hypothetical protein LTV02_08460 [Nocardia yamanashiensis]|uniref:hypothetical protein n=1 Tax=Nocardia yamanashiensis TaxID=209247 RepID=UPI001E46A8B6|nr:hypothetical protein [Nocardia yamanashiensis]UGT43403.1 hypothetical protein LTV02_08460 [Nocardia yamanashiensis]